MTVIVDASALLSLGLDELSANVVEHQFNGWIGRGELICAPTLAIYEMFSGITRRAAADRTTLDRMPGIVEVVLRLPIDYVPPEPDQLRTVEIAVRLQRSSAYDAAYISLAERLGAELWTLDGPLYRNASSFGYPVRLFA